MKSPLCLPARLLPGEGLAVLAGHRRSCPSCRAEAAEAEALRTRLAAWADEAVPAPAGLRRAVLAALGEQDAADPRRDLAARVAARYAAVAGLAAAVLIALTAGLVRRHSRAMG